MAGKRPDYEAFVTQKLGENTHYTKIGVAWNVDKGGVSIKLDGLPIGGEMVLFPPRPKADEKN